MNFLICGVFSLNSKLRSISIWICCLCFFNSLVLASENDEQWWTQTVITGPLIDKDHPLKFFLEYQARHSENTQRSEQGFLRPALMYKFNTNYTFAVGYLSLRDFKFQEAEQRYWQQLQYFDSILNSNFQFRARFEQRFKIDSLNSGSMMDVIYRIRLLFRFQYLKPIVYGIHPLFVNEIMFNLNDSNEGDFVKVNSGFDQNRLFLGFYKEFTKQIAADIGYLHVNSIRNGDERFYIHGGFLTIYMKF